MQKWDSIEAEQGSLALTTGNYERDLTFLLWKDWIRWKVIVSIAQPLRYFSRSRLEPDAYRAACRCQTAEMHWPHLLWLAWRGKEEQPCLRAAGWRAAASPAAVLCVLSCLLIPLTLFPCISFPYLKETTFSIRQACLFRFQVLKGTNCLTLCISVAHKQAGAVSSWDFLGSTLILRCTLRILSRI